MADLDILATSLGSYLRTRRNSTSPADVGLPATARRRVPGLRREEVAELVGLSTDYYVRLEQGRADHPSDEVLDALCRGLRLVPAERAHLYDLARPPRSGGSTGTSRGRSSGLRSALRHIVQALPTPALIMNERNDVLAWNPLAAALIADFPHLAARERNMARRIFLAEDARLVHPDWEEAARTTVGMLRMAAGRQAGDPELVRLVGELSLGSETFRRLWASHHVHEKTHGAKRFRHRTIGEVTLNYETFQVPGDLGLLLVVYSAPAGSSAEEALDFLASFTASSTAPPAPPSNKTSDGQPPPP